MPQGPVGPQPRDNNIQMQPPISFSNKGGEMQNQSFQPMPQPQRPQLAQSIQVNPYLKSYEGVR